jgi:D-alanyl-D-alanine carboxypeptidase
MPLCCENAIAAVLPADGGDYQVLFEKDADAVGRPMSISKVLTAICVLDILQDLQEKLTYHQLDTNIGPFYVKDFAPGDTLTYMDALHAMMLESSNVTAQALARVTGHRMVRDITSRVHTPQTPPIYPQEQAAFEKFIAYMNEKAAAIGMTSSHFDDAAGMDSLTTARDLLKLMAYAQRYPALDKIWTAKAHTATVTGDNPRLVECASKSTHPDLDQHYRVLGKKGGMMDSVRLDMWIYNLAVILEIPGSRDRLAVVALYAQQGNKLPNNRFKAACQVADIAMVLRDDPDADVSKMPVCCENAIAAILPADGSDYKVLYEKNADAVGRPMSISKVMTAVCVLDHIQNLQEKLTYHELDTKIGGFYVRDFLPGDTLTYEDALYALMLNSSNVTAQALARSVGHKI